MVMAPDASTFMDSTQVDTQAIDDLARGEYRKVQENMPRDYVQMYHPDGSTSIVQLPPLGKNGKGRGDRQRKIMHFILNKRAPVKQADGTWKLSQWWYPSPPEGWQPQALKWRCPVQGCTRAGGLPDLLNLYRHIQYKHPGEVELYEGVIKAIKVKLADAIPPDLQRLLNEEGDEAPMVSPADIEAAKFEDAADLLGVEPETFAPVPASCADCDWTSKPDTQRPDFALALHRNAKHKENDNDDRG